MGHEQASTAQGTQLLVASVQRGDRAAETELVERYGRGVMILLRARTRDPQLAQDLYQDTFERVLEKVRSGDLRNPDALQSFVQHIAANMATEHYRKAQRRGELDTADPDDIVLESPVPLPEQVVMQEQRLAAVRAAISSLPTPRDRIILQRYFIEHHSRDAICEDLKLDVPHFRRVVHRAMQRLKTMFKSKLDGGEP